MERRKFSRHGTRSTDWNNDEIDFKSFGHENPWNLKPLGMTWNLTHPGTCFTLAHDDLSSPVSFHFVTWQLCKTLALNPKQRHLLSLPRHLTVLRQWFTFLKSINQLTKHLQHMTRKQPTIWPSLTCSTCQPPLITSLRSRLKCLKQNGTHSTWSDIPPSHPPLYTKPLKMTSKTDQVGLSKNGTDYIQCS